MIQLILVSVICLALGGAIGYFLQKIRSQQVVIDKELLIQQLEMLKNQQADFRNFHEEALKSARSVMFEASREVSRELLDNHKRENVESRKEAEAITKRETENLHKEFKTVVEQLASLKGQHQVNDKKLSAIWQSLTSPVKAANFAEIGLENTLKLFGLESGVDFFTQSAIEGTRLRPDAIINLPSGNLMLIDAKTSRYFTEEGDAEVLKAKLKSSMNTHLKQLMERDYTAAARVKNSDVHVTNVMYLPNEAAYGRVLECDGEFGSRCRDSGVLLVTPTSLHMLLSIATHQISRARQEQNHQKILAEMGKVVSSVDNLLRGLNELGVAIRRSADVFSKLSGPINSRVIPRIRNVLKLGLEPEKEVKLPQSLPNFNIIENEAMVVEMEAAEPLDNLRTLEKKAG